MCCTIVDIRRRSAASVSFRLLTVREKHKNHEILCIEVLIQLGVYMRKNQLAAACHCSEIALAGSRRLCYTLAAAPDLFAHADATVATTMCNNSVIRPICKNKDIATLAMTGRVYLVAHCIARTRSHKHSQSRHARLIVYLILWSACCSPQLLPAQTSKQRRY